MNTRGLALNFIRKRNLTVVSTVDSQSKPESAVIEFAVTPDLELIFDTFSTSRKYKNIQKNRNVAFVFWASDKTVQYAGVASELRGKEIERYKNIFFAQSPHSKKFEKLKVIRYFKVVPKWIRFADYSARPWKVSEIRM